MMMRKILFILDGYPYKNDTSCVFVKKLIVALADMGYTCTVVAPRILTPTTVLHRAMPYHMTDRTDKGNVIHVYSPRYLYTSAMNFTIRMSMDNHYRSVCRVIQKEKIEFDAVYGHFIFQCGLTAARIGKAYGVKSFLGAGESDKLMPDCTRCHSVYRRGLQHCEWKQILSGLSGIICVSEWTKHLLFANGFLDTNNVPEMIVCPNGVDTSNFRPESKEKVRKQLKLPDNAFICVFVGAFNDNKGALRVDAALKHIEDAYAVYLGRGTQMPTGKNILFCGKCSNEMVLRYLQAADCFILPTRSEGCCNAIIEAICCGLPIISSKLPFNEGILDDENSILIDPNDIDSIRMAVTMLKDDVELRTKLSIDSANRAEQFDIRNRATRIAKFMEG